MISVAMTTFNGGKYLREQLESIFRQTVPVSEVVVCDDGSTDDTLSILEDFRRRYPDVMKIRRNAERLGCTPNFEQAISLASGDVIFLSDQDDRWQEDKVEVMSGLLREHPEADGCFSDSVITDAALQRVTGTVWQSRGFSSAQLLAARSDSSLLTDLFLIRVPTAGHDMAIRARAKEYLLPFPRIKNIYDTWIGLCLAIRGKWCLTDRALTQFRQHETNLSQAGHKQSVFDKIRTARKSVRERLFAKQAELFHMLLERNGSFCDPQTRDKLSDRLDYLQKRSAMACALPKRVISVFHEIRSGRYFRYGRGWQSVLQDLFFRTPWGT